MATSYEKVLSVISKRPSQRQDFEIQSLLPWLRKKSRLFQEIKTDYLKDILRNCGLKSFKRDDIVIEQGERGDCFYIILAGKVSIFIISKDKDIVGADELAAYAQIGTTDKDGKLDRSKLGNFATSLGSGEPFGEVALMSDDCIRTATIIAEEQTHLLVVDRACYERCVSSVLAAEFREKQAFIDNNPLFKTWLPRYKKQLAMAMYKETWVYDSVLVRQGDPVSNIYFVISGQVEIRTDPSYHPVQYPHLYKLLEDEREKLIKEKKSKSNQDTEQAPQQKKRENSKVLKLCYFGINEGLGEIEVLSDLDTYIQTAVCAEQTDVLVLEMKHYERLFVKRHQKTIDIMRHNLEQKLNSRISVLSAKENTDVPLLGLIQMKLNMLHNPQPVVTEKKKRETSVQSAEKLFFNHKGPLLDLDGPGSVFYMIRVREKSKLKLKAHQKEGQPKSKSNEKGHVHAIRIPQTLVMAAQIAGAKEINSELGEDIERTEDNEIEIVQNENIPQRTGHVINRNTNTMVTTYTQKNVISPRSFRSIQTSIKSNQPTDGDSDYEDITTHNLPEYASSWPPTHPVASYVSGDQEIRLGMLEEKVKDWLYRENPKASTNVSKLRRLHPEDLDCQPRPGNKIVIRRRRRKSRHSDASSGTGTASSDASKERLAVSRQTKPGAKPTEKYKILLGH